MSRATSFDVKKAICPRRVSLGIPNVRSSNHSIISPSPLAGRRQMQKGRQSQPEAKPGDAKSGAKPGGATDTAAKPEDKAVDTELSPDDAADNNDAPPPTTPKKSARSPNGVYEFREERRVELYTRKIDQMIGVLKSKGVPVLWVGLPAVRGAKANLFSEPGKDPVASVAQFNTRIAPPGTKWHYASVETEILSGAISVKIAQQELRPDSASFRRIA